MEKTTVFVIVALLAASLLLAAPAPVFQNIQAFGEYTELTFNLPELQVEDIELDGTTYQRYTHPQAGSTRQIGYPELPTFSTTLAVPAGAHVTAEFVNVQSETWSSTRVYPSQEIEDGTRRELDIATSVYSGRELWQPETIMVSDVATMRDFHLVTISVCPLTWNTSTGEMTARTQMTLRVHHDRQATPPTRISRSFEPLYKAFIDNYDTIMRDVQPEYQPRCMLVVHTGNDALSQYVNQYMDWKRSIGFQVEELIGTGSTTIMQYITAAYTTWENPPEYVVLIGDASGTYSIPTYYDPQDGGEGDHPYACIEGNDLLPEVFVGRISIGSQNDFLTFLAKMNLHERNVYMADPTFYNHSLLVGDTGPSGLSCIVTNKYVKELITANDPDHTFTELYSGNPSPSLMDQAINEGSLFFNYRGFAGVSGWGESNINALTNINELPNSVIITCGTGSFASGTSRTEAIFRVGSPSQPRGAISSIGMATIHTHTQYNNILTGGIFGGLFEDRMNTMGEAIMRGKLALYEAYWNCSPDAVERFTYWCNLMGDPTINVWRALPLDMQASYDETIPLRQNWLDVSVTDENNQPLAGAQVTAKMGTNALWATGLTDDTGHVTLHFEATVTGTASLNVVKPDYLPVLGQFTVSNTPTLTFSSMTLNEQTGNGNGDPNPGETFQMDVTLHNSDSAPIAGVSGELATSDEFISITTDEQSFETLAANGAGSTTQPFVFQIAPDAPDRESVEFSLALTNGTDEWQVKFWLSIQGNDLDILSYTVYDSGNNALDPGETAELGFTIQNNGMVDMTDVYAELSTASEFITLEDSIAFFGDIAVGSSVSASTDRFTISANSQLYDGMKLPVTVRFYTDEGYEETEEFELPIGNPDIHDPIGPDAGGYMCLDTGDTGYDNCPVYNWIEIDPNLGGPGTNTGIYDSGDEGDQNFVMDMPFLFTFYGVDYNSITICSNGWLAMGATENLSFRNWPIPGPMGPPAMIAAFWEDLYTTSDGGVYTYFDEVMRYFIIEWSGNECYTGGENTFQIILYDKNLYPTSNGNSPIKIQYKVFNNTDLHTYDSGEQGNYCTVGLEDHTGMVGLQYTYNNEYPWGARALDNESALYFSSMPTSHESDYLVISDMTVWDNNQNGQIEAGESVNLGFIIGNMGHADATNVHATLRSTQPSATVPDSLCSFPDVPLGQERTSLDFVTLRVAEDVTSGQILSFMLLIESDTGSWQYPFMLTAAGPHVTFGGYLLNDSQGNNNGIADPGETILLGVNVKNNGLTLAEDVAGALSTTSPYATITSATAGYSNVSPEYTIQGMYELEISSNAPTATAIPLHLHITGHNVESSSIDFAIAISTVPEVLDEQFDTWLPDRWTIDQFPANWSQVPSSSAGGRAPEVQLSWNPEFTGISRLISSPINLMGATDVSVSFRQMINDFNGANQYVLGCAIRANNSDWECIWETPGQDCPASYVEVDITSPLLNQPDFQFAWYLSGNSYYLNDWYLDEIYVNATLGNSARLRGELTLVNGQLTPDQGLVRMGEIASHPDVYGDYTLLVHPGTYDLLASAPFYTEDVVTDIVLNSGDDLDELDLECHWMAPARNFNIDIDEVTPSIQLTWDYNEPATTRKNSTRQRVQSSPRQTFEQFQIWRQVDTAPFAMVDSTTSQDWSENIDEEHTYRYYVVTQYAEGLSDSTRHVCSDGTTNPGTDEPGVVEYTDWLGANYPNPFNPVTTISFSMSQPGDVELKVYNVRGQLVRTLVNEPREAGVYEVRWEGRSDAGRDVSSGVYFYRLCTPQHTEVRKALLLK